MNVWGGRKILVTGAGGFIGSHLVETLVREGAAVRAFIRYRSDLDEGELKQLDNMKGDFEIARGDLREQNSLRSAVRDVEAIFHLGALGSVPYSFQNPMAFFEVNVLGTGYLLDAAVTAGVERFLLMSTSEIYGNTQEATLNEMCPLRPRSPYAASKIAAEKLVESYQHFTGLKVVIARAFNVYGPRQSVRNVILSIIAQALRGETVRLGNVDSVRDYNYVSDTVSALLALSSSERTLGQTFNIGTGVGSAIREVVLTVGAILGRPLQISIDDERVRGPEIEVSRLVSDSARLREVTNWTPTIPLEEGLRRVISWAASRGQLSTSYAF